MVVFDPSVTVWMTCSLKPHGRGTELEVRPAMVERWVRQLRLMPRNGLIGSLELTALDRRDLHDSTRAARLHFGSRRAKVRE